LRRAFSLIELLLAITLSGVMAFLSMSYYNTATLSKTVIQSQLLSQFDTISATIFQCKTLSNQFPLQVGGALASSTLLDTLECNTTIVYALDGGKNAFIPPPLKDFSAYRATQNASEFYFSTSTPIANRNDEVLQSLRSNFSSNQYELTHDATTAYLKFYLSR